MIEENPSGEESNGQILDEDINNISNTDNVKREVERLRQEVKIWKERAESMAITHTQSLNELKATLYTYKEKAITKQAQLTREFEKKIIEIRREHQNVRF